MNETQATTGSKLAAEVAASLRSRQALHWIVTPEEGRVERALIEAAASAKYDARLWDCVGGVTDASGKEVLRSGDPDEALRLLREQKTRAVWIFRDLAPWLKNPTTCRAVRNLARSLPSSPRDEARAIIVLVPPGRDADVPPELQDHAVVIKWKLPDKQEIASIFDSVISGLPPDVAKEAAPNGTREAAIDAALGLSAETAAGVYAKTLVTCGKKIVPRVISEEKKRVVSARGLTILDPDPRGVNAIGGLDPTKDWLLRRKLGFSEKARAFGLPTPRGMLLVGHPGCGKSLVAKCAATAFESLLVKMDLGGMLSKFVGESQTNLREALGIIDAIGKCVVWIDEIEKALAGSTGEQGDGGVSSDALGTLLGWMQERKGAAFVIATANKVSDLPPELLRKGRFDEIFFVDLPTQSEREAILRVSLGALPQGRWSEETVDVPRVSRACRDYTGAEIAAIVPEALGDAFLDGERMLKTEDLLKAADNVAPLAKTAAEKIESLRAWAKGRARPASLPEVVQTGTGVRELD